MLASARGTRPAVLARRQRAVLVWGLVFFACLQLAFVLLMEHRWPELCDPEYGRKLARLRARLAKQPEPGPLVLLLGSSRIAVGVRPGLLATRRAASGEAPLIFNFALTQSGPLLELLCLRRLLADGFHPDFVLVEAWVPALGWNRTDADEFDLRRLRWHDLSMLGRYVSRPARNLYREWCGAQLVPWYAHRVLLLNQYAPSWLPEDRRCDVNWLGLDDWGWLCVPRYARIDDWNEWRLRVAIIHQCYARNFADFRPGETSDRALRELLALCRQERIGAALLLTPDEFRGCYAPAARAHLDEYLRRLSREEHVPVIDARSWVDTTGFYDSVHLVHASATAFTQELDRRVLRPLLTGRPLPLLSHGEPPQAASVGHQPSVSSPFPPAGESRGGRDPFLLTPTQALPHRAGGTRAASRG